MAEQNGPDLHRETVRAQVKFEFKSLDAGSAAQYASKVAEANLANSFLVTCTANWSAGTVQSQGVLTERGRYFELETTESGPIGLTPGQLIFFDISPGAEANFNLSVPPLSEWVGSGSSRMNLTVMVPKPVAPGVPARMQAQGVATQTTTFNFSSYRPKDTEIHLTRRFKADLVQAGQALLHVEGSGETIFDTQLGRIKLGQMKTVIQQTVNRGNMVTQVNTTFGIQ